MQEQIKNLLTIAISKLLQNHPHHSGITTKINVEPTKNAAHGDFASNIAMVLAKQFHQNPMHLAQNVVDEIGVNTGNLIHKIEIAKPGFINFYLTDHAYHEVLKKITDLKEEFGHTIIGKGKLINIEFVSSNPTGPLHVGHGRGAAFGATVSNLIETMGFKVHREYYVNDAGRQIHILTLSIWLRYLELEQKLPHFPSNGYKGSYIIDIARQLKSEYGAIFYRPLESLYGNLPTDESKDDDKESYINNMLEHAQKLLGKNDYQTILQSGVKAILSDIKSDLEEFGVVFDEWFSENHLIKNGAIQKGIKKLQDNGYVYSQDGALWFRATDLGDEKDRVLIRANGQTTYFASDVGYHLNKYDRGFDKILDVFGSDHHGYISRITGFLKALKLDTSKLEILLVQFAILYRDKQKVQMSTRSGEFVTLRQLRNEVGNDAARFFYIMRKNDQHLDFDLDLAKSQSTDNPVYYIQYAYARICNVLRQMQEKQLVYNKEIAQASLALLNSDQEKNIIRRLIRYPLVLQTAAINYEPHILAHYTRELANDFHAYYNAQQFLVTDEKLRNARLYLIIATKQILKNSLTLLGVSAPKMM